MHKVKLLVAPSKTFIYITTKGIWEWYILEFDK